MAWDDNLEYGSNRRFLNQNKKRQYEEKRKSGYPFSKIKTEIARILKEEGYIANFKAVHNETKGGVVRVFLKYTPENECVIQGLKRVSKPGSRVYSAYNNIPKVRGAFGISILSTSKGLMTDAQAKAAKIGGELLCQVW